MIDELKEYCSLLKCDYGITEILKNERNCLFGREAEICIMKIMFTVV